MIGCIDRCDQDSGSKSTTNRQAMLDIFQEFAAQTRLFTQTNGNNLHHRGPGIRTPSPSSQMDRSSVSKALSSPPDSAICAGVTLTAGLK